MWIFSSRMKACAVVQGGNEYVMCNSALGALDEEIAAEALQGWLLSEPAMKLAKPWGVALCNQEHPARMQL